MNHHFDSRAYCTPGHGRSWPYQSHPPVSVVINNMKNHALESGPVVVVVRGPNHFLHFLVTVMTCGLWAPVWLLIALSHGASGGTAAIVGSAVGGLVFLGFLSANPLALLPVAVLAAGGYFGHRAYERAAQRRAEQAEIANRAEAEYRAAMLGHPGGIYGQYPPAY